MKKINLLLMLFVSVVFMFSSCSSDDDPVYKHGVIEIPNPEGGYVVKMGELLTINPEIETEPGDVYEWSIDGKQISNKRVLEYTFEKSGTYEVVCMVVNDIHYYLKSAKVTVKVLSYTHLDLSKFDLSDGIATAGGKYWVDTYKVGEKGKDGEIENAHVKSQIFRFSHTAMDFGGGWTSWDGFTVSNSNDNSEQADFVTNQFASMAKGGVKGESTPYLVVYAAEGMRADKGEFKEKDYTTWVQINDNENSYKAVGAYVSNHSWPYYCITKGNGVARKFKQGDYLKLKAYGVDAENNISEQPVEFYLADYRSVNESEWTVNDKWEWMDLSSLGEVKYIFFKLETTDKSGNWSNTSLYFCLDNLTVEKID
ncbi:DUF4465 domain-containing protein [Bacteroides sp. 224]|uniref:DUF4465 domain-containing protein n=1 Tax=Bacteroides sp. 224 TaxID=2302936 RepID=UPI0013D897B3|nr:DUF4465 domain-containing protein [Bacteroides sp. 224]NDV65300.1 DUF4465 domain-containing protein [Bacteroides sp. 224]